MCERVLAVLVVLCENICELQISILLNFQEISIFIVRPVLANVEFSKICESAENEVCRR